jgi:DNA replication protein DnaC
MKKTLTDIINFSNTIDTEKLSKDEILDLCIKFVNSNFEFTVDNTPVLKQLKYYFEKDSRFNGDLNKSILLMGWTGSGKTEIMQIFHIYSIVLKTNRTIAYLGCNSIIDSFAEQGITCLGKANRDYDIILDEFGEDSGKHYHFGSLEDPISSLLLKRYIVWQSNDFKTHLITNLDPAGLQARFQERVYDRMIEMYNTIVLNGKSFRKK